MRRDFLDDKLEQTIEKYDFQVKNRYRVRGAILLDTMQGLYMIRRHERPGEHFAFENRIRDRLAEKGFSMTDRVKKNRDGEDVTKWENGENYVAYRWYPGRECDSGNRQDLCRGADNLGRLHLALRGLEESGVRQMEDMSVCYERRRRELKRVYRFMKEKRRKSAFELYALSCYAEFAKKARDAEINLSQSAYFKRKNKGRAEICHGEYNYHNLIMTPEGVATTNFGHMYYGMQLMDLAYFFRKVMEKNDWNVEKGRAVLNSYRQAAGLLQEEEEFLRIVLSYPEKYRKLMNHYMNGKKTWISDKNMEKLRAVKEQEQAKESFLYEVFSS